MANLYGTGINQIPTNGMLGNLAFQDKAYVSVDKVGIGSTFVDTGTSGQILQVYGGGAYVSGSVGIGTTNPTQPLDVNGNLRLRSGLYDFNNSVGTTTSVLVSTGAGVSWTPISIASIQGLQGITGSQGTQGLQGLQGTIGSQGTQGLQGLQGITGSQGTQGIQGIQGITGSQGTQGIQGLQGTTGTQGTQGIQGLQGTTGTQGTQGIQGTQGLQGLQGTTGSQGTQGLQGLQGTSAATSITNNTNNYVVTATGDSNTPFNGESNLIFDGSTLKSPLFESTQSSGDEGGEIKLNKATTNTTLDTGVTIDVWQNRVRLFETGGSNRGGYWDISALGVGVTTNLLSGGGGGTQGTQGTQGLQGLQGITGSQGTQGLQGIQGITGSQGTQGLQGLQGISGPSTSINAEDNTTSTTLYPVMVNATGSATTAYARSSSQPFVFNSSSNVLSASQLDLSGNATTDDSVLYLSGAPLGTNTKNGLLGIGQLNFSDTDVIANFTHNVNSYAQVILQNRNSGTNASTDFIVNNDRTAGTTYYGDFGINATTFSGGGPFGDADGTYLYSAGGTLSLGSLNSYNVKIATNNTERITITGIGSIGVGNTNPSFAADIAGDARITSTNKMRFGGTAGTTNFYIQYNSTANSLDFVAG